jgi:tetratricopeptide (TPR) repeat protein
MTESRRNEIYNNLLIKDTEELLDIWQNGDEDGWDEAVFEIIEEILLERLDSLPPKSTIAQLRNLIGKAEDYFQNGDLEMALQECDQAIQIAPKDVLANHLRGLIYE